MEYIYVFVIQSHTMKNQALHRTYGCGKGSLIVTPITPYINCYLQLEQIFPNIGYNTITLVVKLDHEEGYVRGLAPETQVGLSRYSVTIKLCSDSRWRSLYILS